MSGIMSRWAVSAEYAVQARQLDDSGAVHDEIVAEWVAAARDAVCVTASAAEIRPTSFRLSVRLRPGGGSRDTPVNTAWIVSLLDPVSGEPVELGTEVRDELITLEHAARFFN